MNTSNIVWFFYCLLFSAFLVVGNYLKDDSEQLVKDAQPLLSRQRRALCGPGLDCQNGGVCNLTGPSPFCSCPKPYSGPNCTSVTNYCFTLQPDRGIVSLPVCLNNGTCSSLSSDPFFRCTCASNYTGVQCELFNTCAYINPCINGLCVNTATVTNCSCYKGWTGSLCSINIDDCQANPCKNGGRCIDGNSSFTCDCSRTDYTGLNCTSRMDNCLTNPCKNGGTCSDGLRNFTCQCFEGYSGTDCSNDYPDCNPSPCSNDSVCLERSNPRLYGIPSLPEPFNGQFEYSLAAGFVCDKGSADATQSHMAVGIAIGVLVGFLACAALAVIVFLLVLNAHKQKKLSLGYFSRGNSQRTAELQGNDAEDSVAMPATVSETQPNGGHRTYSQVTYVEMNQNLVSDRSSEYVSPSGRAQQHSSIYLSPDMSSYNSDAGNRNLSTGTTDSTCEVPNSGLRPQPVIELFSKSTPSAVNPNQSAALTTVDEAVEIDASADEVYLAPDVLQPPIPLSEEPPSSNKKSKKDAAKANEKSNKKPSKKEKIEKSLQNVPAASGSSISLPGLAGATGAAGVSSRELPEHPQRLAVSQIEPCLQQDSESRPTNSGDLQTPSLGQTVIQPPPRLPKPRQQQQQQQQQPPELPARRSRDGNNQPVQAPVLPEAATTEAGAAATAVEGADNVYDTIDYASSRKISLNQQQKQQDKKDLPSKIDPSTLESFEKFC